MGESFLSGSTKYSLKVAQKLRVAGIYKQDIVQSAAQEGVYDMVTGVAGDSDSDSGSNVEDGDESSLEQQIAKSCLTDKPLHCSCKKNIPVINLRKMYL